MKIILTFFVILIFSIKFVKASIKLYDTKPITFINLLLFIMKFFSLGTIIIIGSVYFLENNI
jgi:hypothetical protein